MPPDVSDASRLWDMLHSARLVLELTAGMSLTQYTADIRTRLAVERSVEIIGEAARGISDVFQVAHPEIPWRKIIAQRHILVHEYGEIQDELMWKLILVHLPELVTLIAPLVDE